MDELPGGWGPTLDDLAQRRAAARAMGGEARLQKRTAEGRLNARQRVECLLDKESFREIGTLVGDVPSDAFVAGTGRIDGRPVLVGAEDFTTVAGTIASGSNSKRSRLAELALQERAPLIMLLEGAGFRPTTGGHGARSPTDLLAQVRCSGHVPVITGVLGASAGHGALVATVSDFTVMTRDASIFTAGPPVVKDATGEDVHKLDLGGPGVAIPSGLIQNLADDDEDALAQIRRYLSYMPSSAWSYAPERPTDDSGPRETPELLEIVPRNNRQVYDMHRAIDVIVDDGQWFEVQPGYGQAIICGLAHLGGEPVAVVANQPKVLAGSVDTAAANKGAHFMTVADSFHLPIVLIADNPGVLPGTQSEKAGILRAGGKMFAAVTLATTIKLHVTFRKAYGFGSMVMGMSSFGGNSAAFAFPGATMGAMGASAHGKAAKSDDEQMAALRNAELQASYNSASSLGFDELIDPRETRNVLLDALGMALHRRQSPPAPVSRVGITP
jgi:acetyl-CoA carboxylase carboxyltransferase component